MGEYQGKPRDFNSQTQERGFSEQDMARIAQAIESAKKLDEQKPSNLRRTARIVKLILIAFIALELLFTLWDTEFFAGVVSSLQNSLEALRANYGR